MCLFTCARTVAIVFARSEGSAAMYCAGVLTFDGGFIGLSSSRDRENEDWIREMRRKRRALAVCDATPACQTGFSLASGGCLFRSREEKKFAHLTRRFAGNGAL